MLGLIRNSLNLSRLRVQRNVFIRSFSNTSTEDAKVNVLNETPQQIISDKETNTDKDNVTEQITFAKILRYSPHIQMGDPNGSIVVGTIFEIMHDDLYVDFGGKYHCVCRKPRYKADSYVRGAKVRLRLTDLELASKFLGSSHGITLREAEGTLLGLYNDPSKRKNKFNKLKNDLHAEEQAVLSESDNSLEEFEILDDNVENEINANLYENK